MKQLLMRAVGVGALVVCLGVSFLPSSVGAYSFIYHFDIGGDPIFSGTPPAGPPPWVDATFADGTGANAGSVLLTIANSGLSGTEKLVQSFFNFDPTKDPKALTFQFVSSSGSFTLPTILQGANAFQAGSDGKYDLRFDFSTSASGAFGAGESVTYKIGGAGVVATNFIGWSLPAGGKGPFLAAGHVLSIGADGSSSAWIAPSQATSTLPVPEPASASLLALTGLGAWAYRRLGRKGV